MPGTIGARHEKEGTPQKRFYMNIAIDIRSTLKNRTGIGTYTFGLVNALAGIDRENRYILYSYIRLFDIKRKLWPLPGKNFSHRVDRFSFSPERAIPEADILHTSSYDMPASGSYRLFTTVHDLVPLIFPEGYSDDYLMGLEGDLKRVFAESSVIFADSVNTKNDIEKRFPGKSRRIEVVYPGRDRSFKVLDKNVALKVLSVKYGIKDRFLLYAGGMDPRKNIQRLLEAFSVLKKRDRVMQKMVIVGKAGRSADLVLEKVKELGLENDVVFTGYVPEAYLNYFYSASDCFVYPSLYEGFGFPIIEAFASGVPVVASSASSCGEIASNAAIIVDPYDIEDMARAIREIITSKELSSELIAKGEERAGQFSWEVSARRVLELFRGN